MTLGARLVGGWTANPKVVSLNDVRVRGGQQTWYTAFILADTTRWGVTR